MDTQAIGVMVGGFAAIIALLGLLLSMFHKQSQGLKEDMSQLRGELKEDMAELRGEF